VKILTSEQMKSIDRRATEQFGVPSLLLMEDAAQAVLHAIRSRFAPEVMAIFCGPGQNGGDGFALARLALSAGITPLVIALAGPGQPRGDAATNAGLCRRLGLPFYDITSDEEMEAALARASSADLVVDAIFGTGLTRPPEGRFAEVIRQIPLLRLPIVSVDVPSGIDASSNRVTEPAIRADLTVTFCAPKVGHIFQPAASFCGDLIIAPISIPPAAVDAEGVTLSVTTRDDVAPLVAPRDPDSHKGTYGHVGILAGSPGRSGAAILSARGALRGGAGLVTVLTDASTADVVDSYSVESMTRHLAPGVFASEVVEMLSPFDSLVVGPGLLDDDASYAWIREILSRTRQAVVVDATALNAFQGRSAEMKGHAAEWILTPHPGELARLLGTDAAAVNADRLEHARRAARQTGSVVILKGHQTIVAAPDGMAVVNPTGNAGMATGGMGDVLSGIAAALLARGHDAFDAARAAVYLHGLAGDLLRARSSDIGLAAMDLADELPAAVRSIRNHE
jgi:hydroxyethylthiazole kinase-like uncharacterized protein yjeF